MQKSCYIIHMPATHWIQCQFVFIDKIRPSQLLNVYFTFSVILLSCIYSLFSFVLLLFTLSSPFLLITFTMHCLPFYFSSFCPCLSSLNNFKEDKHQEKLLSYFCSTSCQVKPVEVWLAFDIMRTSMKPVYFLRDNWSPLITCGDVPLMQLLVAFMLGGESN